MGCLSLIKETNPHLARSRVASCASRCDLRQFGIATKVICYALAGAPKFLSCGRQDAGTQAQRLSNLLNCVSLRPAAPLMFPAHRIS